MEVNRMPDTVTRSIHDYWTLFLFEGSCLNFVGTISNHNSINRQYGRDPVHRLAIYRKWSYRPRNDFLGATHTWILVVSRVRFARGHCWCRLNRAQVQ